MSSSEPDAPGRWSVMIPAYESPELLEETLRCVTAAAPASAHIEVVDDASTEHDLAAVVARFDGRVGYWRNPQNQGAVPNFNHCIRRAQNEFVHILHADDLVTPEFYLHAQAQFDADPQVGVFVCRAQRIDGGGGDLVVTRSEVEGGGIWANAEQALATSNRVMAAGIAARASVYDAVGLFAEDLPHAADWHMWFRMAQHSTLWFDDDALVSYRVHAAQHTASIVTSGANIVERRECIRRIGTMVAPGQRRQAQRKALLYSAVFASRAAVRLARSRDPLGAITQTSEALRCVWAAILPPG